LRPEDRGKCPEINGTLDNFPDTLVKDYRGKCFGCPAIFPVKAT
jgi:hypothetical protein